jgi:hypothetical protein
VAMRQATSEDTQAELSTQRSRERDDAQKELDGAVAGLIKEWEVAGSADTGIPNLRYEVDDVTDAKRRVGRAFSLASRERTPKLAAQWWKDGAKDADGYTPIKFGVRVVVPNVTAPADGQASQSELLDRIASGDQGDQSGDQDDQSGDQGDQSGDTPPFDPGSMPRRRGGFSRR